MRSMILYWDKKVYHRPQTSLFEYILVKKKDIDISKEKLLIYDFKNVLVKKRNKIYISKEKNIDV